MKQTYDHSYNPPAPVVTVTVSNPSDAEKRITVNALLDTGADVTVLPQAIADALGAKASGEYAVYGVNHTYVGRCVASFMNVDIGGVVKLTKVVALGGKVILGRNTLNDFRIQLDGPAETLSICLPQDSDPAPS